MTIELDGRYNVYPTFGTTPLHCIEISGADIVMLGNLLQQVRDSEPLTVLVNKQLILFEVIDVPDVSLRVRADECLVIGANSDNMNNISRRLLRIAEGDDLDHTHLEPYTSTSRVGVSDVVFQRLDSED